MQINYAEYDVNGKKLTVRKDGASLTVMVKDPETGKCVADYFTSRDVHFDDTASEVYRMGVRVAGAIYGISDGEKYIRFGVALADMPFCDQQQIDDIIGTLQSFDI